MVNTKEIQNNRKYKIIELKLLPDTMIYLPEWLKKNFFFETDNTKCCESMEQLELSSSDGGNRKCTDNLENSQEVSYKARQLRRLLCYLKLSRHPGNDWIILLLAIYPREMKTYGYTKTCTGTFAVAFFMLDKPGHDPRVYPRASGWVRCATSMQWTGLSN